MAILSKQDRASWEENEYVVVHRAVPQESLDAMVDAVWTFLEMDPNDPDDWYREPHRSGQQQ